MIQTKRSLYIALILALAFAGALAVSRQKLTSRCPKMTDFIPNRCIIGGARLDCNAEKEMNLGAKYPACVCWNNGTCEFRSDKTRCEWCNDYGAASVNEGERCPKIKEGSLFVCPQRLSYPVARPLIEYADADLPTEELSQTSHPILTTSSEPLVYASHDPIAIAKSSKQESLSVISAEPQSMVRLPPIKPVAGCICTSEGVCKPSRVYDAKSSCEDNSVVAVVVGGSCPRTSACRLRAPKDASICQASDRYTGTPKICPKMAQPLHGCICDNKGICKNQSAMKCTDCQDPSVYSVTTGAQCDCV